MIRLEKHKDFFHFMEEIKEENKQEVEGVISSGLPYIWQHLMKHFNERFKCVLNNHNVRMTTYLHPRDRAMLSDDDLEYCRQYLNSKIKSNQLILINLLYHQFKHIKKKKMIFLIIFNIVKFNE